MRTILKRMIQLAAIALTLGLVAAKKADKPSYPIGNVPFTQVKVVPNTFWGDRIRQSREVTIPLAFSKCEETDRYTNFEHAAAKMAETARGDNSSNYRPTQFPFDDTDVYKTIEGASYLLQTYPDKKLEAYIDSVLDIVAAAQEPDGYLYTARTMNPAHPHDWSGPTRWSAEESGSHELYNLGHMVEGAIAHYQATGSRKFLDIAIRYADCVCREIGYGPGQKIVVPGHQIAEMALAKLYLVTGDKKYLDEAKLFLDNKGKTARKDKYDQSYKPVIEQDEAVGHSVRAGYMYSGMADVAALTGDQSYVTAIDRIWDNMVGKKMYLTGGIGSTGGSEGFTENYDLPNMNGYCETCAAIANVYTNYRLFLLHGDAKYMDVLERALYNGVISGVSLDGGGFFYPNPLESHGQHQRQAWFGCACCPSNICRFIPSVPGYVYAVKDNKLFVNLFMSNTLDTKVNGKNVQITQSTEYPWNGDIKITVDKTPGQFCLNIRIPGWVRNQVVPTDLYRYSDGKTPGYTIQVNGETVEATLEDGYFGIDRKWKKGDVVSIHFDMEPRIVTAHRQVVEDRGKIAVERGPLVYCAEWTDNDYNILNTSLPANSDFKVIPFKMNVEGRAYAMNALETTAYDNYTGNVARAQQVKLRLIPYYAWAHRGNGNMEVWMTRYNPPAQAAQAPAAPQVPEPTAVINLWPNGAPTDNGLTGPERVMDMHVSNVTQPTLTVWAAPNPNGLAVIACPGGGYTDVWNGSEGNNMAQWYMDQGITLAVLKYRLPNGHTEVPLDDLHEAMRLLKADADKYGIKKIGVQGCSAGGHLAATAATHYNSPEQRPDFQILFYPVITMDKTFTHMGSHNNLLGRNASQEQIDLYSNEKQVTRDTPPAFIMANSDDNLVPVRNSIEYYNALQANRVRSALHVYPTGGHGWCANENFVYRQQWMSDLKQWLSQLAK